jgi:hypothetical protein
MKTAKAARVPVLENAFEVNLPKLLRATKATASSRLVLDDGNVRTVAVLTERRLAVRLGGQDWLVDIVPIQCLNGRVRSLLKCPRAHEGNFQSLYFFNSALACKGCHKLRYRSTLESKFNQMNLAREKLVLSMGGTCVNDVPRRRAGSWRKKYRQQIAKLGALTQVHYSRLSTYIEKKIE